MRMQLLPYIGYFAWWQIFSLSENFEQINVTDLQSELKILIHVGGHENIVNLLGACTKGASYNFFKQ